MFSGEPKFKNINIIKNEFHKVGEVCSVECKVKSYPLSDVSWAFKECSNYEHCETKFNNISVSLFSILKKRINIIIYLYVIHKNI